MNALSLRALERIALQQHEARITTTRGADLPKHEVDRSLPNLREACEQQTFERAAAITELRCQGFDIKRIAAELKLTVRQIGYVERQMRKEKP